MIGSANISGLEDVPSPLRQTLQNTCSLTGHDEDSDLEFVSPFDTSGDTWEGPADIATYSPSQQCDRTDEFEELSEGEGVECGGIDGSCDELLYDMSVYTLR